MTRRLCVIPGDGIGQEVIPVAVEVLTAALPGLETVEAEAGWATFEKTGTSVPGTTLDTLRECGAGLFGAVSSPSHKVAGYRSAILTMRQELGLYANIRPVRSWPGLTPRTDIDLIVVRENSEGLYSGLEESDGERAVAQRVITRTASIRIGRAALDLMRQLDRHQITIVHKANVLPLTDGLFRDCVLETVEEAHADGFDVEVNQLLVDVAALKLLEDPARFDVIVTTNLFGDILSDAASHWGGGLGLAPSLNCGDGIALAEPVHGSAPDIAGQGIASPVAAVLSASMLARHAWQEVEAADRIETAVAGLIAADPGIGGRGTAAITRGIMARL